MPFHNCCIVVVVAVASTSVEGAASAACLPRPAPAPDSALACHSVFASGSALPCAMTAQFSVAHRTWWCSHRGRSRHRRRRRRRLRFSISLSRCPKKVKSNAIACRATYLPNSPQPTTKAALGSCLCLINSGGESRETSALHTHTPLAVARYGSRKCG